MEVALDSLMQKMQAREGHQHLHMDPAVFYGGIETSHNGLGRLLNTCTLREDLCRSLNMVVPRL